MAGSGPGPAHWGRSGSYSAPDGYDASRQAALAEKYPDKDILFTLGGYIAVPKGTPVVVAQSLSRLAEKLQDAAAPGTVTE